MMINIVILFVLIIGWIITAIPYLITVNWFNVGSWIANLFACGGAYESSKPQSRLNPMRMNLLFTIANIYSVFYFISTDQYPYLLLQSVFLVLSVKGIINNYRKKKLNTVKDTEIVRD